MRVQGSGSHDFGVRGLVWDSGFSFQGFPTVTHFFALRFGIVSGLILEDV